MILPVELSRFVANFVGGQGVFLNWETASELNNKHFRVERSLDGRTWSTLAEVKGAGTSSEVQNYNYMDKEPANGVSYYRLRQTDYDGTFKFSETRQVNVDINNTDSQLVVYPNPTQNTVYVAFGSKEQKNDITFYNMIGQEVMNVKGNRNMDNPIVSIDISSLRSGVYFVKSGQSVTKFYKN